MAKHLNDWVRFPVVGFPSPRLPMRVAEAAMRNTIGPSLFRKILKAGSMPAGNPTLRSKVYRSSANSLHAMNSASDAAAVAELVNSIEQFRNHQSAIYPSPLFGAMNKSSAERLQWIHMAHHLSFLVPMVTR